MVWKRWKCDWTVVESKLKILFLALNLVKILFLALNLVKILFLALNLVKILFLALNLVKILFLALNLIKILYIFVLWGFWVTFEWSHNILLGSIGSDLLRVEYFFTPFTHPRSNRSTRSSDFIIQLYPNSLFTPQPPTPLPLQPSDNSSYHLHTFRSHLLNKC